MGHIFFFTLFYNVYTRAYWRTAGYAPASRTIDHKRDVKRFPNSTAKSVKFGVFTFVKDNFSVLHINKHDK